MWLLKVILIYCVFTNCAVKFSQANDFPSLLVANATLGVLLDREYLNIKYDRVLEQVQTIIAKVIKDDMRDGGIRIKYYAWTDINFDKDFTAIVVVTDCARTWQTYKKAQENTLLLIALTDSDCPRIASDDGIMIPLFNKGDEVPQIIYDIRSSKGFNWKSAIMLYDKDYSQDTISRVALALSYAASMSVSMFQVENAQEEMAQIANVRATLRHIARNNLGHNLIVLSANPYQIIDVAKQEDMMDTFNQWFFIISNSKGETDNYNHTKMEIMLREGSNVAFAVNKTHENICGILVDCFFGKTFKGFVNALSQVIREEKLVYGSISDEEWEAVRLTKKEKLVKMLASIKQYLLDSTECANCSMWTFMGADTWGFHRQGNDENINEYTAKNTERADIFPVGFWEITNGLTLQMPIFPNVEYAFSLKRMLISTIHNPPWQIINYNESGEVASYSGLVLDMVNELAKKLNFTYEIFISASSQPMSASSNAIASASSFNYKDSLMNNSIYLHKSINDFFHNPTVAIPDDILDLTIKNKVLISAIGSAVQSRYKDRIKYTVPISLQPYSYLTTRPHEISRLFLFASPFSWDTWICLIALLIIIGPLLYLMNWYCPFYDHIHLTKRGGLFKISNCFWYIYGALLQQGGMYLPRSDSGRLIIGTWWLVVLVIVTTYCGNLVAYLTFPKMETPIKNIAQLTSHKEFLSWGMHNESLLKEHLLLESENYYYNVLIQNSLFHTNDSKYIQVIDNIKKGRHVYLDWKINLNYMMKSEFMDTDICDLMISNEEFLEEQVALIMPINSPYYKIINKEITRMHQMGFIEKWLQKYLPKKDKCSKNKQLEITNHTVNLNDMQGCFMVLLLGMSVSMALILIECIWRKYLSRANMIKKFQD